MARSLVADRSCPGFQRASVKARGITYTAWADADFYAGMCGAGCRDKMVEHWGPHLDGKRSIPDALSALVAAFK